MDLVAIFKANTILTKIIKLNNYHSRIVMIILYHIQEEIPKTMTIYNKYLKPAFLLQRVSLLMYTYADVSYKKARLTVNHTNKITSILLHRNVKNIGNQKTILLETPY